LDFQDYELVSSWDALWVLEFKDKMSPEVINKLKEEIQLLYENSTENAYVKYSDRSIGFKKASDMYGELLLRYINNQGSNITLIRRDFND
jgi:hypothetical protein